MEEKLRKVESMTQNIVTAPCKNLEQNKLNSEISDVQCKNPELNKFNSDISKDLLESSRGASSPNNRLNTWAEIVQMIYTRLENWRQSTRGGKSYLFEFKRTYTLIIVKRFSFFYKIISKAHQTSSKFIIKQTTISKAPWRSSKHFHHY